MLPIIGAAVVVGSGFSAWLFTDTMENTVSANGTVSLEPLADQLQGKLEVDITKFYVHLDQGGIGNIDASQGVWISADQDAVTPENTSITLNFTYTLTATAGYEFWEKVQTTYTVSVSLSEALNNYIELTDSTVNEKAVEWKTTDKTDTRPYTKAVVLGFKYKDGKKPTSREEYTKMKAALDADEMKVTVAFTAHTKLSD